MFAKNDEENLDTVELIDLKDYAKLLFALTDAQIATALQSGPLEEIE
ncbi:hypothetical protein BH11ARM2_BH11ARM2_35740 [soil metagenome]